MTSPTPSRRRSRWSPYAAALLALSVLGIPLTGGCKSSGGMTAEGPPLPDVSSARRELERAEGEIYATFPRVSTLREPAGAPMSPGRSPGAAAPPITSEAPPPAPPPLPVAPADDGDRAAENVEKASGDPCAIACRALSSMRRAADRLCELTGEEDAACVDARERVRAADERVRSGCADCA